MARPKSSDPAQPFPVRLRGDVRAKFIIIAERERRRPAELGRLALEDYVAAYEEKNGPITLPEPPK